MSNLRQAAQQAIQAMKFAANPNEFAAVVADLEQALAEPEQEPVAVKWTLNGDKHCRYDNWLGETPFGRILITWKSWKEFPNACVDEFPGGFEAYGDPEKVKVECEAEFRRRLGAAPTPRKPVTDADIDRVTLQQWGEMWGAPLIAHRAYARAVIAAYEAKQGEQT